MFFLRLPLKFTSALIRTLTSQGVRLSSMSVEPIFFTALGHPVRPFSSMFGDKFADLSECPFTISKHPFSKLLRDPFVLGSASFVLRETLESRLSAECSFPFRSFSEDSSSPFSENLFVQSSS